MYWVLGTSGYNISLLYLMIADDERLISCGDDDSGCLRVIDVRTGMELLSKNMGQELR